MSCETSPNPEVESPEQEVQRVIAGCVDRATRRGATNGKAPQGPPDAGISAAALMRLDLKPRPFVVHSLLCEGLSILAARPKHGKSWLALQASLAVALGMPVFGSLATLKGDVLYVALEDTRHRLRKRLAKILAATGWNAPESLDLRTAWRKLSDGGLLDLEEWLAEHPDRRLVVIDTLAKVRQRAKHADAFSDDYETVASLKTLADRHRVAILVIHHTRKGGAEDPFDELSGTLGINAAADGIFVLDRRRGDDGATLFTTGRDIDESSYSLRFDGETCVWSLLEVVDGIDTERRQEDPSKLESCITWLKAFLADFAFPSKEIEEAAKRVGHKFQTLKNAKARLKDEELRASKEGRFQGAWWNGFGHPADWVLRPTPPTQGYPS